MFKIAQVANKIIGSKVNERLDKTITSKPTTFSSFKLSEDERVATCLWMTDVIDNSIKSINRRRPREEILQKCVQFEKWCYINSKTITEYTQKISKKLADLKILMFSKRVTECNIVIPNPKKVTTQTVMTQSVIIQAPKQKDSVILSNRLVLARMFKGSAWKFKNK